jgi:hypothetical protein
MRLAWFRSHSVAAADRLDPCASVVRRLSTHTVDEVTAANAHDFVWQQRQQPVDLCVFELDPSADAAFIWPYLFRYPGVLVTSEASLHNGRAAQLEQQDRAADYTAEFIFNEGHAPPTRHRHLPRGSWPMHRAAFAASRLVVVRDQALTARMQAAHPQAQIRDVPLGIEAPAAHGSAPPAGTVRCAVFGADRVDVARRAAARAVTPDTAIEVTTGARDADIDACDIVLALTWPAHGESLMAALAGLAAGKPVVLFDVEAAAQWPSLDPQTWRQRGPNGSSASPIAITIDPRDEEHSLMLAVRRLAAEPGLRESLGAAARRWWMEHATLARAVEGFESVLEEAATMTPAAKPADWPPHLSVDGTGSARAVLDRFGVQIDFLS